MLAGSPKVKNCAYNYSVPTPVRRYLPLPLRGGENSCDIRFILTCQHPVPYCHYFYISKGKAMKHVLTCNLQTPDQEESRTAEV